jgi:hypothetical protein
LNSSRRLAQFLGSLLTFLLLILLQELPQVFILR